MIAFTDQLLDLLLVCSVQLVSFLSCLFQLSVGVLYLLGLVQQPLLKLRQLLTELHHLQSPHRHRGRPHNPTSQF